MSEDFPIVIVGAGPAGAAASLFLSQEKIPHLIIEKEKFPRDKICGDAVSGKGLEVIAKVKPEAVRQFADQAEKSIEAFGIRFVAPNGRPVDIALPKPKSNLPVGILSRRIDFDNFLYGQLQSPYCVISTEAELIDLKLVEGGLELTIENEGVDKKIRTPLVISAEGSRSIVKKRMIRFENEDHHFCGGIRAYYTGVKGMLPGNYLELHFLKELLPGYLWVFPLPNGAANVGLGMLSADIKKRRVNLRKQLEHLLATHASLKDRFAEAKLEGPVKGWGLPLGSRKRQLSGAHFMLTGDAASLIDPFTGEGVGNAIISGMVAARIAKKAVEKNDFSAEMLKEYDRTIYQKLWKELKLSHRIQRLTTKKWLFNFVINKINSNRSLQQVFTNMFNDIELRSKIRNPLMYIKLLFRKSEK